MQILKNLLSNYNPSYEEEKIYKSRIIHFIENYKNIFSRTQTHGHFTASSLLLNKDCTKFLLMYHKKLNKWLQLGGHCDGESDILAVAIKESSEESGIEDIVPISENIFDIDIHAIPANSKDPEHFHYDIRFLLKANNDDFVKNEESHELKWVDLENFDNREYGLEHSVTRMIEKYKDRV